MPFPYTLPFYFDYHADSSDSGSGAEGIITIELALADTGSGIEALITRLLAASELGNGSDRLGVKIESAAKGGEMKLPTPMGKVSIPSKEESI